MGKIKTICGICPGQCHVECDMDDRRIKSIKKSDEKPSALCLRGLYSDEILNSEDRLTDPLIRTGEKGTLEFKKASWDEAMELIKEKCSKIIEDYGAKSIASHFGRGAFDTTTNDFISIQMPSSDNGGFLSPIGSPNNGSVGSLCFVSFGIFAPQTVFGLSAPNLVCDLQNTEMLCVWGANPKTDSPPFFYNNMVKRKNEGMKIIAVDHYNSDIIEYADYKYIVNSGTDMVLILGILNYLKDKLDQEFIEKHTYGYDEFKEYFTQFDLEKTSEITGLEVDKIKELANLLFNNTVALKSYTGLEYSHCGVQTIRSLYILWSLLGNLDVKGGLLINKNKPIKRVQNPPNNAQNVEKIGSKEFPLFDKLIGQPQFTKLPQAILESDPYPIKGLINLGSCMSVNYPNSKLFRKALKSLDFYVTCDRFMTEDAYFADVILPATTYYEEDRYAIYPDHIEIKEKLVEPLGNSLPNIFILKKIADALGFGEYYPENFDELLDKSFYQTPEILKELKENGVYHFDKKPEVSYEKYDSFNTETGKIEIHSKLLEKYGFSPIPVYDDGFENEHEKTEKLSKYPFTMNTGARIQTTFRTQHLNINGLLKHQEYPQVIMNEEDAKELGIENMDLVEVYNDRASVILQAVTNNMSNRHDLEINVGGGSFIQDDNWKDANINMLIDNEIFDPISGFPVFKRQHCNIRKVK